MSNKQDSCRRCGKCCNEGGPALHGPDLELITSGRIPLSALITLRKGELAHNPVIRKIAAIENELVKLKGTGREWNCYYYDSQENSCTIYDFRPQACGVLKCWAPDDLLEMVGKDTLSRFDILQEDNPLRSIISEHERLYPCPDMEEIASLSADMSDTMKRSLQKLANEDLRFRTRVVKEFDLKLSDELFYFGRPVFQLLQPLGARVSESALGIELSWVKK